MTKDEERARKLLEQAYDTGTSYDYDLKAVVAYADEIRAEAADRAVDFVSDSPRGMNGAYHINTSRLRAAITGKEPL